LYNNEKNYNLPLLLVGDLSVRVVVLDVPEGNDIDRQRKGTNYRLP
jgi:hypothetical protein